MFVIVVLGAIVLLFIRNLITHWHIITSILNQDMQVYRLTLNIIEDHQPAFWVKDHKKRIEWINNYTGSIVFPPGLYIKCKPVLLEKWYDDEVVLVRLDQHYHPQSDQKSHLSITRECRFITYHNRLPDADVQYTQIEALVFDCSTVADGTSRLIEEIYKRSNVPILWVCRPLQRILLYHESRLIRLADSKDLGYAAFLDLFDVVRP